MLSPARLAAARGPPDSPHQHRTTMRVFSGSLATETNTFGPMPTSLASFRDRGYFPAGQHPDHMRYFSGPLGRRGCAARSRAGP